MMFYGKGGHLQRRYSTRSESSRVHYNSNSLDSSNSSNKSRPKRNEQHCKMSNQKNIQLYVAMQFVYLKHNIALLQSHYIKALFAKFGMVKCNPNNTPIEEGLRPQNSTESNCANQEAYQCLVGSLIFYTNIQSNLAYFAEHRVFINVAKEAVWIRVLLCKLKHIKDKSTSIYCDNIGAIQLVKNSVFHALTKYIELQHYFI
uniref:Reverse transcriptase Ty1/copia-type domain-containing protein n=1 Tax=Physcomitrium patens TaxID=3218 RepID=A0A2K1KP17_PHYPA|nr:hypothetical protein PHYPA_006404 [Physcomitrium patens]